MVITSAFALAGSSRPPVAVREVTPVAAGTSTGTAPQTSGLGTANPGRVSSGNEAAGTVNVGTGSAGKITLTALDGAVRWTASSSAPNQVSLSSTAGTLAAGQSVTLAVTVTRGAQAGSATLTFDSAASASRLVLLTWSASASPSDTTVPDPSGS